jgi:hypothetical protein
LRALPVQAIFLAILVIVLIAIHQWIGIARWIWLLSIGFGAWGFVGDLLNVAYLSYRIHAAAR